MTTNKIIDGLLGVAVGDAVGVPFEFRSRLEMEKNPARDMIGYGTHRQPEGTWSDDSSLTFCLAESLIDGYDLKDIASKFIAWKNKSYWTARGKVFDIGMTTSKAITRLENLLSLEEFDKLENQKYYGTEMDNGNGSLMRILPLICYVKDKEIQEQFEIIWNVSSLTHRHIRAGMSCLIYLKMAENLINGLNKTDSYEKMRLDIKNFWDSMEFAEIERKHFARIIQNDVREIEYSDLKSGGYVIESIEASLWCLMKKENFEETILSAINLGHDTDTTAAIAGGLAGINYGFKNIPEYWVVSIARMEDIMELGNKLNKKYWT